MLLDYRETPVVEIVNDITERAGVRLLVKREDLNHPTVSGNKWWKLKYNLEEAQKAHQAILTFGGAYSNHIFSTAAAAKETGLHAIGVIRGEQTTPLNSTLRFALDQGMILNFVTRASYREKTTERFIEELHEKFGDFYLIPEGGTNHLSLQGTHEFATKHLIKIPFDYLMLPVGTAGTMSGIVCGLQGKRTVMGISVLKNGDFLKEDIRNLVEKFSGAVYGNWEVLTSYDQGGYAKINKTLVEFISAMKERHDLPLDPVYTGKLMWAVFREIEERRFPSGSTVLALHTGGLQNQY